MTPDIAETPTTLANVLDALPDAILIVAADQRIAFANAGVERLLGHAPTELRGQSLNVLLPERYRTAHPRQFEVFLASPGPKPMGQRPLLHALTRDGREIPVGISISVLTLAGTRYAVAALRDAMAVREHLDDARQRAESDPLTGAGNRASLLRHGKALIERRQPFAVLYLDLNEFKPLNDIHGHRTGDQVLREVAQRLLARVRGGDRLARVGGDEFVLLLAGMEAPLQVEARATAFAEVVRGLIDANGVSVSTSAAIGAALYPSQASDLETLLALADAAMYESKRAGRAFTLAGSEGEQLSRARRA